MTETQAWILLVLVGLLALVAIVNLLRRP